MLLCGLVLSSDATGSGAGTAWNGIVTADEISTLDLSDCELAVLSACQTGAGVRQAGLAISSLQRALHIAGARSVVTSLWNVPDESTKELMVGFYRGMWSEKKSKSRALWDAKMALRASGHPLRDWAGWVLSGDSH